MKMRWLSETTDAETMGEKKVENEMDESEVEAKEDIGKVEKMLKTGSSTSNFPPKFEELRESEILCDYNLIKEAKVVRCFCEPTEEDLAARRGCGPGCINRELNIECGSRCPSGARCTNRRFQNKEYANVETFDAGAKGIGLRAVEPLEPERFIMEYVGEIINAKQMRRRLRKYAKDPAHVHHYMMRLKNGTVIDATARGNISRFINHSCDPNCESQKWIVSRRLRIGFFAIKPIAAGEEIVFDYHMERFGRKSQHCLCGSANCRGSIGDESEGEEDDDIGPNDEESSESEEEAATADSPLSKKANENGKISKKKPKTGAKPSKQVKKKVVNRRNEKAVKEAVSRGCPRNRKHVKDLVRLIMQVEDAPQRCTLVRCLLGAGQDIHRLFVEECGLQLLYVTLANCYPVDERRAILELQISCMDLLDKIPISTRNQVVNTHIANTVARLVGKTDWLDDGVEGLVRWMVNVVSNDEPSSSNSTSSRSSTPIDPFDTLHQEMVMKANRLLEKWKTLREEFRIPRRDRSDTPNSEDTKQRTEEEDKIARRSIITIPEKKKVEKPLSWKFCPAPAPLVRVDKRPRKRFTPTPPSQQEQANANPLPCPQPSALPSDALVTFGPPPARRSRFDIKPEVGNVVPESCDNYVAPPGLIPEEVFSSGLATFPGYPPVDWSLYGPVSGPFDTASAAFYQQYLGCYQQQQLQSIQQAEMLSILEAPAPPKEPQPQPEATSGKQRVTIQLVVEEATDEEIGLLEKTLALAKEYRAARRKKEKEEAGNVPPPPPPDTPPKKSKWVQATTEEGVVYYYNRETRESTWVLPEENEEAADTTTDRSDARTVFKADIAKHVAGLLERLRKTKFETPEDYKYVLRKLTHAILEKEMKHVGDGELKVTDSVREKARKYVEDYITRLGDGPYCRKNKHHNAY